MRHGSFKDAFVILPAYEEMERFVLLDRKGGAGGIEAIGAQRPAFGSVVSAGRGIAMAIGNAGLAIGGKRASAGIAEMAIGAQRVFLAVWRGVEEMARNVLLAARESEPRCRYVRNRWNHASMIKIGKAFVQ